LQIVSQNRALYRASLLHRPRTECQPWTDRASCRGQQLGLDQPQRTMLGRLRRQCRDLRRPPGRLVSQSGQQPRTGRWPKASRASMEAARSIYAEPKFLVPALNLILAPAPVQELVWEVAFGTASARSRYWSWTEALPNAPLETR
jgi:hypothetical protein